MKIDATKMDFAALNEAIRGAEGVAEVEGCLGQRFIGAGLAKGDIRITGIPGNALGAYLDGARIEVRGNAQDAVGDTMNAGTIVVRGNIGDTAGYAMRGGAIYVRGDAGYRAGIHMKAYREKLPVLVIGGAAGSFLGEYQAGGLILVLGLGGGRKRIVGDFPCTGMHGGKMLLRTACEGLDLPPQVTARAADDADRAELRGYLETFCDLFDLDIEEILAAPFTVITPDSKNPYKQMYVAN